jgi:hypothetical protein
MLATHDAPVLFRNTMQIAGGHLESFKHAVQRAVEFVKEHGPQLMVEVFLDEQRLLAYSFQLYRDSESILVHWKMSDPHIREVMEHCTVQRLDVYGRPNEAVMKQLRRTADHEVPVTVTPHFTGFTRFLASE